MNRLVLAGLVGLLVVADMETAARAAELEEVVVTARRRAENLQEIPVAVSVLSEGRIEREAIRNIEDVARLTANLTFDQGFWPADTRVSIRGLFARAGRPSTAILVDGIDASSESMQSAGGSSMINTRLFDIERIEVVKGPQSALYGRGAFAGAINYVTRRPNTEELETVVSADAAEDGRYELRGSVAGPINDDWAFRVNAAYANLDGYYENPNTGDDVGGYENTGVRGSLLWTPTDRLSLYWTLAYSETENDPQAVAAVTWNEVLEVEGVGLLEAVTGTISAQESDLNASPDLRGVDFTDPNNPVINSGNFPGTDDDLLRTQLIIEWDLVDAQFKSSTAYTDLDHSIRMDTTQQFGIGDPRNLGFLGVANVGTYSDANYEQEFTQFSQEFTLSSPDDSETQWLLGINAFIEDAEDNNNTLLWYRDPSYVACAPPFSLPCDLDGALAAQNFVFPDGKTIERDTTSLSIFGLVSVPLTDTVTFTAEARAIYDKVEVETNTEVATAALLSPGSMPSDVGVQGDVSDTNIVPRFSLDWAYTDSILFYGSIANGIKPPTIYTTDFVDAEVAEVDKEDLWAYEIGAKTSWLDNQLIFNTALYFQDYEDQQVLVQFEALPGQFIPRSGVTNAGKVEIWGFEFDTTWQATDELLLGLSYAWNDGEYDEFNLGALDNAEPSTSTIIKSGNVEGDFTGNDVIGIPDHELTFLARYQAPLTGEMEWFGQFNGQYSDERWADISNLVTLDSYWIFDAQLGLQTDRWSVIAYGENVFDDDTIRYAQEFIDQRYGFTPFDPFSFPVAYYAYLPQPRTFGVRGSFRF